MERPALLRSARRRRALLLLLSLAAACAAAAVLGQHVAVLEAPPHEAVERGKGQ